MYLNFKLTIVVLSYFSRLKFCSAAPIDNSTSKSFTLSVIHFSDFHGRFIEVAPDGGLCHQRKYHKCIGGVARVSTIVKHLRKIRPNPIFLNAGDCLQGTLYYDLFKGNMTVQFMNVIHPDVHTIGNHELDGNVAGLAFYMQQLNSPVVVTNIDHSEEPLIQNLYTKSTVIQKDGKDIGIIGVIYSDTNKISSSFGKLKFLYEVQSINLEAKKLKDQGINIIIVLSHCGIHRDKLIARHCPDVDVIAGGHSHVLFYNGNPPNNEIALGGYPLVVTQEVTNRKVLVVHASAFTKYMGDLQIVFDENGEASSWEGNPIFLNETVEEDPSVLSMIEPWKVKEELVGKRVVSQTTVYLNGTCYSGECNLANLVTDAMIDHYANETVISFMTANSIRNSIPKGPIFYEDLYMTLPYNNTWNLIEIKGCDLLKVLEMNVANSLSSVVFINPLLLQWAGLEVVYDLNNENSKVVSAKARCLRCDDHKFEEINDEQFYNVVVNSYILSRDFSVILGKYGLITKGTTPDIDLFTAYIEKKKIVNITNESRMVFVETNS